MTNYIPGNEAGEMILVEVAPYDIDFFNKLLEGYDNLALVTTLDARLGKLALWVTKHAKKDVLAILKCLPVPVHVLEARG
jgi:putative protease